MRMTDSLDYVASFTSQGKIQTIKAMRERTHLGLKEAKNAIDTAWGRYDQSLASSSALHPADFEDFKARLTTYMATNRIPFIGEPMPELANDEVLRLLRESNEMLKDILHMITEGD